MRDENKKDNMANEILIIGVGSAGVITVDKMDLQNSKNAKGTGK
jgi:cell division GTPase FtsZ